MRREETLTMDLLHRAVPAKYTDKEYERSARKALFVLSACRSTWRASFGEALEEVSRVMTELAQSLSPSELAEKAYGLYKKFWPEILPGKKGWGASGKLDLDLIRKIGSAGPKGEFI